ncbi:hypothetical protein BDR06DRAFT_882732 [Suillus hirtellus]|nr:hypothetical protein BDR06DRAFT_882732 [Suillus hirtellus]
MPPLLRPIADSQNFSLDASGVAGFFSGKEAITAMATVHLYRGHRWLVWYNSPGSYTIAKEFSRISNSRSWSGLFPGSNHDPAVAFKLDELSCNRQDTFHISLSQGTDDATPFPLPAT